MPKGYEELDFARLHEAYYPAFIEEIVECQIIGNDPYTAHWGFKTFAACLSEQFHSKAPVALEKEEGLIPGNVECFYAPALKVATLLHRSGWIRWLEENEIRFVPKYLLPVNVARLKQVGEAHLSLSPFKEIIDFGEKNFALPERGR